MNISKNPAKVQSNQKYQLIKSNINSILHDNSNLLILTGEAGMGKSYVTETFIRDNLSKQDYTVINGHYTPLKLYQALYESRDKKVILIDDCDVIESPQAIALLKCATWNALGEGRVVSWDSTSKLFYNLKIPTSFVLNASLILIFNEDAVSKRFLPIISRGIHLKINFTFLEKLDIFESISSIDKDILEHLKKYCNNATPSINIRQAIILSKQKESGEAWELTAKEVWKTESNKTYLIDLLTDVKYKKLKTKEKIKLFEDKTGLSERTFYDWKKLYFDIDEQGRKLGVAIALSRKK